MRRSGSARARAARRSPSTESAGAGHGRPRRRGAPRGDGPRLARGIRARRGRGDGRQAKRRGREAERDGARGPPPGRAARRGRRSKSARRASPPAIRSSPASTTTAPRSTTASAGGSPRSTPSRAARGPGRHRPGRRRVEVGADYLARTNPHSEAPALQHAYAVTTYSAQGATVDRAFVDGRSLDGQAGVLRRRLPQPRGDVTSTRRRRFRSTARRSRRSRPTCARASSTSPKPPSATAPSSPPTTRRCARSSPACRPRSWSPGATSCEQPQRREEQPWRVSGAACRSGSREAREHIEGFEAEREAAQALPRRERREELARIDSWEARSRKADGAASKPKLADDARRRTDAARRGAGRRRSGSRAAARAGDHRRADLPARLHQERAGGEAERSGQAEGMGSRRRADRALPPGARRQGSRAGAGDRAKGRAERARREAQFRRLRQAQRELGREVGLGHARGLGIGR